MKVLIAGGTGLVGKALNRGLYQKGHEVKLLSRKPGNGAFLWDPEKDQIDSRAIGWADAVINLAGAGIADERWSEDRKSLIRSSRVKATQLLVSELNTRQEHKVLINASAIGIYGDQLFDKVLDEEAALGNDFLASVCKDWEAEAQKISSTHRLVIVRIGIVLSLQGGALPKLLPLAQWGMASAVGSGLQGMSWIHIEDLCEAFRFCLEKPDISGVVNGTSPRAVSNQEMMRWLARAVKRPFWMPAVPSFVLKTLLGEMAAVVLSGQQVKPVKLERMGFQFRYPDLTLALTDLMSSKGSSS
jgi:uncharacterized protein